MAKKADRPSVEKSEEGLISFSTSQKRTDQTEHRYANYISVGHSPWDFSISFGMFSTPQKGDIPSKGKAPKTKMEIEVPAQVEINFPLSLIPGLIRALETQKQAYEKQFGPILEPNKTRVRVEEE